MSHCVVVILPWLQSLPILPDPYVWSLSLRQTKWLAVLQETFHAMVSWFLQDILKRLVLRQQHVKRMMKRCLGLWWNIWQLLEKQTGLVPTTAESLLHSALLSYAIL